MPKTIGGLPGSDQVTLAATGTGPRITVSKGERFTISATGFGTATVDMLRRLPNESAFTVVEQYTADTDKDGIAAENMELGLDVSAWTSGNIAMRLGG